MRRLRIRFTLRAVMVLVALVAALLGAGVGIARFRHRMATRATIYRYTSWLHAQAERDYRAMATEAANRASVLDRLGAPGAAAEARQRAAEVARWVDHEAELSRAFATAEGRPWKGMPPSPPGPPPVWPLITQDRGLREAIDRMSREIGE